MTLENLLQQVRRLSDSEKLALIESTVHMLQKKTFADDNSVVNLTEQRQRMADIVGKLFSRPDPIPGQMMSRGIFKGVTIDESDFKAAEWHPSDDELDNAGSSLHH